MKEIVEVFGQETRLKITTELGFYIAWNTDEIPFPENDLESGKAVEEIFLAIQEALVEEYELNKEDWLFFPEPNESSSYFLTAAKKDQLPPEVAANPLRYWYDHTNKVWRTHY